MKQGTCDCLGRKIKEEIILGTRFPDGRGGFFTHTKIFSCRKCGTEIDREPFLCPALPDTAQALLMSA